MKSVQFIQPGAGTGATFIAYSRSWLRDFQSRRRPKKVVALQYCQKQGLSISQFVQFELVKYCKGKEFFSFGRDPFKLCYVSSIFNLFFGGAHKMACSATQSMSLWLCAGREAI